MNNSNFDSLADCIDYLNNLIEQHFDEIIKTGSDEYEFKIKNQWYRIFYNLVIATNFSEGKCLVLNKSTDREIWNRVFIKQTKDSEPYEILRKIDDIYAQRLLINNETVKEISKNICELLNDIDCVEKFNDNLYVITKKEIKYSFICENDYLNGYFLKYLKIKKFEGGKEFKVNIIKDTDFVISIIRFLDILYYSTNIKEVEKIKNLIENNIK